MKILSEIENESVCIFSNKSADIILDWNLEKVKTKMCNNGFAFSYLQNMEKEYKRYLILVTRYSTRLPVSSVVDEMWHTHILFTRDYERMCNVLGSFIHHEPVTTEERKSALLSGYEETLVLYRENWGNPDVSFWPPCDCVCDPEGEGNDDTGGQW